MASTRPIRSSRQCRQVVGLGLPERLADGAARGTPASRMTARATGSEGIRTATVSSPPEVVSGTRADFSRMMVRGPGQNRSASPLASGGTSFTRGGHSSIPWMWTMRGLSEGRPLAAYILPVAAGSRALPARP